MRPDLSSPAGRAAYRRELRRVAIPWRVVGFTLVVGGAAGMILYGRGPQSLAESVGGEVSVAALVVGWALLIVAIVKRTRYHKAHMAED